MIDEIAQHIRGTLTNFTENDSIIFNGDVVPITENNFRPIFPQQGKKIAFVDGGQAEVLRAGNFCLSFIRVAAVIFENGRKEVRKKEFYVFTNAQWRGGDLVYVSKVFGDDTLIDERDLVISSNDSSIKQGSERAPITKVAGIARRFAELALAASLDVDYVLLDGMLEKTYNNEEKYLERLRGNVCALAKSSSLFTTSGNSPVVLLNSLGMDGCWRYEVNEKTSFVKLHEKAKHVFRFEGSKGLLPFLIENSCDALFLGYPYGLVVADQMARVSNHEKTSLQMKFLLDQKNIEIAEYLQTMNAHNILDSLG